jgi:hypothetical protein
MGSALRIVVLGGDDAVVAALGAAAGASDEVRAIQGDGVDERGALPKPGVVVCVSRTAPAIAAATQRAEVDLVWGGGSPTSDDLVELRGLLARRREIEHAPRDPALDEVLRRQAALAAELRAALAREEGLATPLESRASILVADRAPMRTREMATFRALALHEERRARCQSCRLAIVLLGEALRGMPPLRVFDVLLEDDAGRALAVLAPDASPEHVAAIVSADGGAGVRVGWFPDATGVEAWLAAGGAVTPPRFL